MALASGYVTSDPIGLRGGLNTYSYTRNNPLRWIDPRGLDVIDGWEPGGPIGSDPVSSTLGCGWDLYQSMKGKFPPGTNDKYKHCVLSCKIALSCGSFASGVGGIGKEIGDVFGPGNAEWADIVADYRGIQCAWRIKSGAKDPDDQCKGLSCEKCCKSSGY